jgi:ketosteroid isomerase-like protein
VVEIRTAIRELVAGGFKTPGFSISWKTNEVVVARSGDVAYATGTNRVTMNGPDGKQVVVNGKGVSVWRKVEGAGWKRAVDIWNDAA